MELDFFKYYTLAVPGHALLWPIPDATEAKVVDVCCKIHVHI
jgi:hypothetical protein